MHVEDFEGVRVSVCVHYPEAKDGGNKECFAVIKLAEKEVGEHGDANGAVREFKPNNADMAEDGIKLPSRRWVPVGKLVAFGCSYVR